MSDSKTFVVTTPDREKHKVEGSECVAHNDGSLRIMNDQKVVAMFAHLRWCSFVVKEQHTE
ncbi:hypothetical protein [Burkholderia gladioli]|uniref:hypothetical protein n=1 Tax=Burkholderia gladioli TaxID=28095 RepID=UPI002FE3CE84